MHKFGLVVSVIGGVLVFSIGVLVGLSQSSSGPTEVVLVNVENPAKSEEPVKLIESEQREQRQSVKSSELVTTDIGDDECDFTASNDDSEMAMRDDAEALEDIINLSLTAGNVEQSQTFNAQAIELILQNSELVEEVFERYERSLSNQEKGVLSSLLIDLSAVKEDSREIEKYVVNQIVTGTGQKQSEWLALISELGVRSVESRDQVMSLLPSLSEAVDLSSAISSLVPQLVSEQEQNRVLNEVASYIYHENPAVRASAINSAALWGGSEQAGIVEQGLRDESPDVRHAAATSALISNVQSDEIKTTLLSIMNDRSEDIATRIQAHYALTRYTLSGHDYDAYYEFSLEHSNSIPKK
ncbi:MAG: HEAT repeat domain-containing protein [Pseudomonadales bacterium]